jgi:hypothetical protein
MKIEFLFTWRFTGVSYMFSWLTFVPIYFVSNLSVPNTFTCRRAILKYFLLLCSRGQKDKISFHRAKASKLFCNLSSHIGFYIFMFMKDLWGNHALNWMPVCCTKMSAQIQMTMMNIIPLRPRIGMQAQERDNLLGFNNNL